MKPSGGPTFAPPHSHTTRGWLTAACCLACATAAHAEERGSMARSLADLSIEQLLDESVTSVSRRESRWMDTPAAITLLSHEDIVRSGATNLVDVLRIVPGLNVGAVNSNQSSISARGFSELYSNKMLVQIDGRAVYNPIFAGVFWDIQQPMLEDIDRIEVIRGPGASVWGANAVNGVISVVSRSARDTQGGLLYAGGGNVHELMMGGRFGGKIGENTYYRIFGNYREEDDFLRPGGGRATDGWKAYHGGFRIDHYADPGTQLTWQADASVADMDDGLAEAYGANSILRWTRELGERSSVEVQGYFDRSHRRDLERAEGTIDTFDLGAQHSFGLGDCHDILWGLGYRYMASELRQRTPFVPVFDREFDLHLFSAFVQDEYQAVPDLLKLISGLKLEHNDYTGFEVQPSLRAVYTPTADQTVWAAVSRAVRTPSAIEGQSALGFVSGPPFPGPGGGLYLPVVSGSRGIESEILWAYELGYRVRPAAWATIDVAAFYNDYSGLTATAGPAGFIPGSPFGTAPVPMRNLIDGESYGGEVVVTLRPRDDWRVVASYALLLGSFEGPDASNPGAIEADFPNHQVVLRSSHDFGEKTTLDLQLRYVDQIASVPAYLTADIRLAYRPTPNLELSLVGQNLLDKRHPEQGPQFLAPSNEVPRGFYGRVTWQF